MVGRENCFRNSEDLSEQCLVAFQNTGDPEWPINRMNFIAEHGLYREADCPYRSDPTAVPADIESKPRVHINANFKRLSARDSDPLAFIRERLIYGSPVVVSIWVLGDWSGRDGLIRLPGEDVINRAFAGDTMGGHSIVIVGFDDDTRLLRFRNSWGESWGDGGYSYMKYDYYLRMRMNSDQLVSF